MIKDMAYQFRIGQKDMEYLYESANERMEAHPEIADKYKKVIQDYPSFKSEKEALEAAFALKKKNMNNDCQIWAKIEKDDDIYRIKDWWLVTDDWKIKQSAEYIGMALMYDDSRISKLIRENPNIDDIIAY